MHFTGFSASLAKADNGYTPERIVKTAMGSDKCREVNIKK
jgi:hypothetical protein